MIKVAPIDDEYIFDDGVIISETDHKGITTYCNRKFCEISGYTKSELNGKNHNILRHPDMPKSAFADLWSIIQLGKSWTGTIKNLRKDGRYYWVNTYISPIYRDTKIVGYTAARKPVNATDKQEAEALYKNKKEEK